MSDSVSMPDVPSSAKDKYEAAFRALVEMATMGIPVWISDGPVTFGWGEEDDARHVHLGRYDEEGLSVTLTAESLADAVLEARKKAKSQWQPFDEEAAKQLANTCWKRSPGGTTWCGYDKGHEGKCVWERICGAVLHIGDDHGDNSATMRCQLIPGHEPPCKAEYARDCDSGVQYVEVTWTVDERETCGKCSTRMEHADTAYCYGCEKTLCDACFGVGQMDIVGSSHETCEKCYSPICKGCWLSHACLPCGCHKHHVKVDEDALYLTYAATCYRLDLCGQGDSEEKAIASLAAVIEAYQKDR